MKKKTLIILACLGASCYAQQGEIEDAQKERSRDKQQEMLVTEDFSFDLPYDDQECVVVITCEKPTTIVSRLQTFVNVISIRALLGAFYISEAFSRSYTWLAHYLTFLTKKSMTNESSHKS